MEKQKSKDQKPGRNAKKPRIRKKDSADTDGISDANYDTKSYRIYGNPRGEGFTIEENFRRAGDGRKHEEKSILTNNGFNDIEICKGNEIEKQTEIQDIKIVTKCKKKSL